MVGKASGNQSCKRFILVVARKCKDLIVYVLCSVESGDDYFFFHVYYLQVILNRFADMYMYTCKCTRMDGCIHVCMYVYDYVCMYICKFVLCNVNMCTCFK